MSNEQALISEYKSKVQYPNYATGKSAPLGQVQTSGFPPAAHCPIQYGWSQESPLAQTQVGLSSAEPHAAWKLFLRPAHSIGFIQLGLTGTGMEPEDIP